MAATLLIKDLKEFPVTGSMQQPFDLKIIEHLPDTLYPVEMSRPRCFMITGKVLIFLSCMRAPVPSS